ncbi:LemA family protein [Inediibacterium massiliense]|uniref:LemA family protein n=1 Tax=Inediibacterium massiliense TaxID=1658111 RepID=UPI0006B44447|nr:LemA family protein [Inediibacterium massiliense]
MSAKKIKERTYTKKLWSFIGGLILGWFFYFFILGMVTEGDEIPDIYVMISLILSLITMIIYTVGSEFNYLKKLELTTTALYSNISIYKKRESQLIAKAEEIISKFLSHESDIQKSVAFSREGDRKTSGNIEGIGALTDLKVTVEKYPDLKSDKHISHILVQLEESQNTILNSKLSYNEYVTYYNTAMVSFPAIMFSGIWKIKPLQFYVDEDFNE